jgi:AcrR family transcriptional regulator
VSDPRSRRVLRRTAADVRADLLAAARELFAERGYHRTTTKELAQRANASETLIFRHFGGKRGLFEAAVVEPIAQMWQEFEEFWARPAYAAMSDLESARYYARLVYDVLDGQRDLILALHAATQFEEGFSVGAPVDAILRGSQDRMEETIRERGFVQTDAFYAMRLSFGLILSTATFDDWLFAPDHKPPRDELIEQLAIYIVAALSHRDKLT